MIHQYKNNGYNIVLDVNSGSVHVVDELVYEVIELLLKKCPEHKIVQTMHKIVREVEGQTDTEEGPAGRAGMPEQTDGREKQVQAAPEQTNGGEQQVQAAPEQMNDGEQQVQGMPEQTDDREQQVQGMPEQTDGREKKAHDDPEELPGTGLLTEIMEELIAKYPADEIGEALQECRMLADAGVLFTEDVYENAITDYKARKTVVKALCLHIAHDCNLACKYCFAEEGEYHGRRALMSFEVGKKALDFLIANSGDRRNLEVDFFGGEPLMNWQVVKDLVAYGREQEKLHGKNFRFTLTTNGVLLNDEIMEFCNREMANVVLSVDGRKEVHDRMRPFRGGKGSYDLILPKFKRFADSRGQQKYYVRGTFTHYNLDFANDVLHLADEGFEQISVEPVVAPSEEDYALRKEDLPTIFAEYDRLAAEMVKREREGRGFTFFHYMIDLSGGPCVYKRLSGCGSGTEYLAVTPWGDLYPCHQFVGVDKYLMGNVDEGITKPEIVDEFKCCNVYTKEKCRNCFAKFYCSGGCAANSYNFHGTIQDAYDIGCELQRKRVECAIMIKAALAD